MKNIKSYFLGGLGTLIFFGSLILFLIKIVIPNWKLSDLALFLEYPLESLAMIVLSLIGFGMICLACNSYD